MGGSVGVGVSVAVGSGVGVSVAVGSGVGVSVAVGSGVGVSVAVGSGVGVSVGAGVGVGVGAGVGVGVGAGVGVGVGAGVGAGVGRGHHGGAGAGVGLGIGVSAGDGEGRSPGDGDSGAGVMVALPGGGVTAAPGTPLAGPPSPGGRPHDTGPSGSAEERSRAFVAAPPGGTLLGGISTDDGAVIEGEFDGAGTWLAVVPNAATATAATTNHAADAAIPTSPARSRPCRAPRTEMTLEAGAAVAIGGAPPPLPARTIGCPSEGPRAAAPGLGASLGLDVGGRIRVVGPELGRRPAPGPADPDSGAEVLARAGPGAVAGPSLGSSRSRNGAHRRQAPSTRFQQSEQQVTPQRGQL